MWEGSGAWLGTAFCVSDYGLESSARDLQGAPPKLPRFYVNRNPEAVVERREHSHQPVNRETRQIRVAYARKVCGGEASEGTGFAHRKSSLVQQRDDASRQDRLGLFEVGMGVVKIPEDVAASLDQLEVASFTAPAPSLNRPNRAFTRSISDFGVLVPDFDFF